MSKNSKTVRGIALLPSACIGTVVAVMVSLICSGVAAALISSGNFDENSVVSLKLATQFLSVTLGALISAIIAVERKILCCLITSAMYIFTLVAFAILLFSGVSASIFTGILVCFFGCFAAIIVINRKNIKRTQRKTKRFSR